MMLVRFTSRSFHIVTALSLSTIVLSACDLPTDGSELQVDDTGQGGATSDGEAFATRGKQSKGPRGKPHLTTATTGATTTSGGDPFCGDGQCNGVEACETCATDCGACSTCAGASDATTALESEEQVLLSMINQYRAQSGLGALAACTSLSRGAQGHSEDMRDQNYFAHVGLDGSTPWGRSCDACFYQACSISTVMGENIAAGYFDAQNTFNQWKSSPGHDANMLNAQYTVIGIGRATGGGHYGTYWTNVFAGATEASCN